MLANEGCRPASRRPRNSALIGSPATKQIPADRLPAREDKACRSAARPQRKSLQALPAMHSGQA